MNDTPAPKWCDASLASLEKKLQLVRDLVTAVAKGFKTGLFLYGTGGVGKSFTVLRQLEAFAVAYLLCNSRMTAKGLYKTLKGASDKIHVLEDMERLTKDADAQGVLRSAPLVPTRTRTGGDVDHCQYPEGEGKFEFRGGLILISNRPLADMPELRALATRIEVHYLDITDAELASLMRFLASQGYRHGDKLAIGPEACVQVTEYLITECQKAGCQLDLRLQQKCFQTYLQWEADWSNCHWQDLVAASIREATHHFRHAVDSSPREERRTQRRAALRRILTETSDAREQERLFTQQTGASRADFFRRKREIESGEFDPEDDGGRV